MTKIISLILLIILFAGCGMQEIKMIDPIQSLNPLKKGDQPEIQIAPKKVFTVSYKTQPTWEKAIKVILPVYPNPVFEITEKPGIGPDLTVKNSMSKFTINIYYKAKAEEIYTWIVDHLYEYNYKIPEKKAETDPDPLVFVALEGTAHITAMDGDADLKVDINTLTAYPGYIKVTYSGHSNKKYTFIP